MSLDLSSDNCTWRTLVLVLTEEEMCRRVDRQSRKSMVWEDGWRNTWICVNRVL